MKKRLSEIFEKIETDKKVFEFLKTGFSQLDEFLHGGFLRKEFIVLGGPTGKGKSYIAGTMFANVAARGFKCGYFSLEISNEMIGSRLLGAIANIQPIRIMTGLLKSAENESKAQAKAKLLVYDEYMYFYDDVYRLEDIIKEIQANHYDFVVIDFIQNIVAKGSSEYERLQNVALTLQKVAKQENCCILTLSQLSNSIAKNGEKVTEYKGSGGIGIACDLGFFIERQEVNRVDDGQNTFTMELRKNRRGISGVRFSFVFKQPGGEIVSL